METWDQNMLHVPKQHSFRVALKLPPPNFSGVLASFRRLWSEAIWTASLGWSLWCMSSSSSWPVLLLPIISIYYIIYWHRIRYVTICDWYLYIRLVKKCPKSTAWYTMAGFNSHLQTNICEWMHKTTRETSLPLQILPHLTFWNHSGPSQQGNLPSTERYVLSPAPISSKFTNYLIPSSCLSIF